MSSDWAGYDKRTLELVLADIKKTMHDNRRLERATPHDEIIAWAFDLSGKHEVCSIIEEKIRKLSNG